MHGEPIEFDLENPEHCYILGYFWADAYFGKDSKNKYRFVFEVKTDDFLVVWPILERLSFPKFFTRQRNNSINSQCAVKKYGINTLRFFQENKFDDKKNGCPLYFKLNKDMRKFFVKGFLDGDGCIYLNKKSNVLKVDFCSCAGQNWDFLKDFCNDLGVNFAVYEKMRPANHSSHKKAFHRVSLFSFNRKNDTFIFCSTLDQCNVGLQRKFAIYRKFASGSMIAKGRPHLKDLCKCGQIKSKKSLRCRKCSYLPKDF